MSAQLVRVAQGAQAAEGALAVRGRRVDQHAGHRLTVCRAAGVDALGDRGRRVAALDRQLPDDSVSEGVQQDVAQAGVARLRVGQVLRRPPLLVALEELGVVLLGLRHPMLDGLLPELEEDALATGFRRRYPRRITAGQAHPAFGRHFQWAVEVTGRLDAGEADQRPYLPQLLHEDDLLEILQEVVGRIDGPQLEEFTLLRRRRVGENGPLRGLQIGWLVGALLAALPFLFDRLPDVLVGVLAEVLQLADGLESRDDFP